MRHLLLHAVLIGAWTASLTFAQPDAHPQFHQFPPRGPQRIVILRVLDGDTVEFGIVTPLQGRLFGGNCPEKNTPAGQKARARTEQLLPPTQLHRADLRGPDKFGRQLLEVRTLDDRDVMSTLIAERHAAPWDGQGPRPTP